MQNDPKVVVLIPYYDDIDGLYRSIDSIKEELLVDIVIVDDGSKIKPDEINLKSKYKNVHDIFLITLTENKGIENALNEGLAFIKRNDNYKYIARLDLGDTCKENRISIQYKFLENNPDIYLVGSAAICTDLNGQILYLLRHKSRHENIRRMMFLQNMFVHPSVMFRVKAIDIIGYYPTQFKYAEDYAYFFKFIKNFKVANISKPLIYYEINPNGISMHNRKVQVKNRMKVMLANWEWNFFPIIGLIYNVILYIAPLSLLQYIKKMKYIANEKV